MDDVFISFAQQPTDTENDDFDDVPGETKL